MPSPLSVTSPSSGSVKDATLSGSPSSSLSLSKTAITTGAPMSVVAASPSATGGVLTTPQSAASAKWSG